MLLLDAHEAALPGPRESFGRRLTPSLEFVGSHQRPPPARLRQLEEQVEVPVCLDTEIVLLGGPHIGLDRFAPCFYDIESHSNLVSCPAQYWSRSRRL